MINKFNKTLLCFNLIWYLYHHAMHFFSQATYSKDNAGTITRRRCNIYAATIITNAYFADDLVILFYLKCQQNPTALSWSFGQMYSTKTN